MMSYQIRYLCIVRLLDAPSPAMQFKEFRYVLLFFFPANGFASRQIDRQIDRLTDIWIIVYHI